MRAAAVSGAGRTGCGGGVVWLERPRSLSHASFSLPFAVSTCLHPKVATVNSAHIASVLRRITSLQRKEDTGAILTTKDRRVAALRMRHDPHHIASHVADAANIVGRTVRILCDVPQDNLGLCLELGRRPGIDHVPPVPM